jgi:hypothetical protein
MVKVIFASLGEGIGTQWHMLSKIFFGILRWAVMQTSIDAIAFAVRWLL